MAAHSVKHRGTQFLAFNCWTMSTAATTMHPHIGTLTHLLNVTGIPRILPIHKKYLSVCVCDCSVHSHSSPDENVTVTASPDVLAVSGSWVTVTYKGVEKPSKDDLVAVYSPTPDRPSLDPRQSAPIKFIVSWEGSSTSYLYSLTVV